MGKYLNLTMPFVFNFMIDIEDFVIVGPIFLHS